MPSCFKDNLKYIHILNHILDLAWPKLIKLNLWNNNTCCLSHTANNMPADALATLGASASAHMVLTPKDGIFHL